MSLIILSSVVDYVVGFKLGRTENSTKRKVLLAISLFTNLGLLVLFKYLNFFIESFASLIEYIGLQSNLSTLNIILPVGISFYTFQTLSYTIDVYNKKIEPSDSIIKFFAFVSFFPQLVAGPIERASNLLPQFSTNRRFSSEKFALGSKLVLWGLFKKVVVADNCATLVNYSFSNIDSLDAFSLTIGAIAFSFQIYGDFSGYSDIAIGIAYMIGFNLMINFRYPYFSRDIAEFWRRWHISLSTWFRDYIYIPLGGSRKGKMISIRNIFVIFLTSGFWHGANWTFLFWGGLNALYFLPSFLSKKNRRNMEFNAHLDLLLRFKEYITIVWTFILVTIAWVFFRSADMTEAFTYLGNIFSFSRGLGESNSLLSLFNDHFVYSFGAVLIMLFFDWKNRFNDCGLQEVVDNIYVRFIIYIGLTLMIFNDFSSETSFIYFQF